MSGRDQRPRPPAHYLGYGLTLAGSTFLVLVGGQALDGKLGTGPLFTLLGAFVGAAAGFWYMYRNLVADGGGSDRKEDEE